MKKKKKHSQLDKDTWNLDWTIANFALPRLIRFKKLTNGYPPELTEKEWGKILDKMIWSMTQIANDTEKPDFPKCLSIKKSDWRTDENGNRFLPHKIKTPKEEKAWKKYKKERDAFENKINEGITLFGKYFRGLWW
jgi:hypothetical protein